MLTVSPVVFNETVTVEIDEVELVAVLVIEAFNQDSFEATEKVVGGAAVVTVTNCEAGTGPPATPLKVSEPGEKVNSGAAATRAWQPLTSCWLMTPSELQSRGSWAAATSEFEKPEARPSAPSTRAM